MAAGILIKEMSNSMFISPGFHFPNWRWKKLFLSQFSLVGSLNYFFLFFANLKKLLICFQINIHLLHVYLLRMNQVLLWVWKKRRCILIMFKVDRILQILKNVHVRKKVLFLWKSKVTKIILSLSFLINKDLISSGDFTIQGVQTAVFKYFVIKICYQLCSLVNWGFKVMISFVTDWGVIGCMSFIQSSLSHCSAATGLPVFHESCATRSLLLCHHLPPSRTAHSWDLAALPSVKFHFYLLTGLQIKPTSSTALQIR